jgi:hypothetical protein
VSYRPTLAGRALAQFNDLKDDQVIHDALMERIVRLAAEPWDDWPVYPGGEEPEFRRRLPS